MRAGGTAGAALSACSSGHCAGRHALGSNRPQSDVAERKCYDYADVDRRAFDPKAIACCAWHKPRAEAIAKSSLSDARVTQWEFSGLASDDRKYTYLEAARARPVAVINADLKMQF